MFNKPITVRKLIEEGILSIGDGYRAKNNELSDQGVPFARAGNINDGFHFEDTDKFPEQDLHKVGEKLSRAGDILFTSKGTVGRYAIVDESTPRFVYSPQLCYWRSNDHERIDPAFLYYYMQGNHFKRQIDGIKGQTDMADYVSLRDQKGLELILPEIECQRSIASILVPIDDKIELNRKQNRTLEAIAQALFKRWFVEFEFPDENGQPYKSSGGAMQSSELGEIPVGWEVGRFGDIAINKKESANPAVVAPDTAYVGLDHIGRKCLALSEWGSANDVSSNKSCFLAGDVLFGKLRPYFHKVAIAPIGGICSTDILVLCCRGPEHYCYTVMHAFSDEFVNYSNNASTGTRMPRANWKHMNEYTLVLPPVDLLINFNSVVLPIFENMRANTFENRTLTKLRDTLLPKLMSGELRVTADRSGSGEQKNLNNEGLQCQVS